MRQLATSEFSSSDEFPTYDFLVILLRLFVDLRELLRYLSLLMKTQGTSFLRVQTVAPSRLSLYLEADLIRKPLVVASLGSLTQSCLYLAPCDPVRLMLKVIFYYLLIRIASITTSLFIQNQLITIAYLLTYLVKLRQACHFILFHCRSAGQITIHYCFFIMQAIDVVNGSSDWGLTPLQQKICSDAEKAVMMPGKEMEQVMLGYHWQEYLSIMRNQAVPINLRVVCASAAKNLAYNKKFIDDPQTIFLTFMEFYLQNNHSSLAKIQGLLENIFRAIIHTFFNRKTSQQCMQMLIKKMHENILTVSKICNILVTIIEAVDVEIINNQVIVGEVFQIIGAIMQSDVSFDVKVRSVTMLLKVADCVISYVDLDEDEENVPQEHLRSSLSSKAILEQILSESGSNQQIISDNPIVNSLKFAAISLYSSTWIYNLDIGMFKLCLNSLITRPQVLIDEQTDIMEKIVVLIERSITQEEYAKILHANTQEVSTSLLKMLAPSESYLSLMESDPDQFVQIGEDFCLQQHNQMLMTRVGSLLSSLCMEVDGYLSFLGSLMIMLLKRCDGSISELPQSQNMADYFRRIDAMFSSPSEIQVSICALLLSSISDQIEKRADLYRPLCAQVYTMNKFFKLSTCPLPPFAICNFMLLTAFYPHPGSMNIFLPYKDIKPVYDSQLQACYRIMLRYQKNKSQKLKEYIKQIEPIMILSDHLTPLLQKTIYNKGDEMSTQIQFKILERLIIWLEKGIQDANIIVCNKISNVMVALIQRLNFGEDQKSVEEALYAYLEKVYENQLSEHNHNQNKIAECYIVDIATAHAKRFACIEQSIGRSGYLMNFAFGIIEKNKYILNNCMQLIGELIPHCPWEMTYTICQLLLQFMPFQERQEDKWEYFYLLELGALRCHSFGKNIPNIPAEIIEKELNSATDRLLMLRIMMFLYSVLIADPNGSHNLKKYLEEKELPFFIPPYENKPFCIYLMHLSTILNCTVDYLIYLMKHILLSMQREEKIQREMVKYEQKIYQLDDQSTEVTINACTKSRTIIHPLFQKKVDIYQQFKQMWGVLKTNRSFVESLDHEMRQKIQQILSRVIVNNVPRKIVKIKRPTIEGMKE